MALRLLPLLVAAIVIAAPVVAQAFGPPQLMWRAYLPGTDGPWQPLSGAVVDIQDPEVGILVDTDPLGKRPGRAVTVTHVPDHATASDALRYPGGCFGVSAGGQVEALGQLPFRGFGAYSIHALALTNAQAMSSTVCDLTGAPASDINFTVSAAPVLSLEFTRPSELDNSRDANDVRPTPSSWNATPSDYVCARHATRGPDGTPSGADRVTASKAKEVTIDSSGDIRKVGDWSCAGRFEAVSEGDESTFTGPWGPIFTFDVTHALDLRHLAFTAKGSTRFSLDGRVGDAATDGGQVRVTLAPGKNCPAARAIHVTTTVRSKRFSKLVTVPAGNVGHYSNYAWKLKFEFLGTRFIRAYSAKLTLAVQVRGQPGGPRLRKPRTNITPSDPREPIPCVRDRLLHR